jgi:anti-sigma regulatory factor (Ser/Thr protein kinase)
MEHAVRTRTEHDRGLDRIFAAQPGSIAQVRRLMSAWLRESPIGEDRLIGDIVLAVSEACNNAVLHAYRTSEGNGDGKAFRLVAERDGTTINVTVSDDGDGMTPRSDSPGIGLGLPLMATLCDSVTISPATSGGTVVTMRFFETG